MCPCLRVSVSGSAGRKTCGAVRRLDGFDGERFNLRVRWAAPQRELDAVDGLVVPFDQRLDPAVGKVLDVAVNPFGGGAGRRKHPEAHALHTSTDQKPPRDDHEALIIALERSA